eukprot:COSAG06_NODE_5907_length_3217_cov_4.295382_2_plen_54_part_00
MGVSRHQREHACDRLPTVRPKKRKPLETHVAAVVAAAAWRAAAAAAARTTRSW